MSTRVLTLHLYLEDDADAEHVVAAVNASALCKLEEDEGQLDGWRWDYSDAERGEPDAADRSEAFAEAVHAWQPGDTLPPAA